MSSEKPIQSRPDASNEAWETTAQRAKLEASTLELSDEVEKNARREAEVAKHAAQAAPVRRLGLSPSAIPSLQIITCFFWNQNFFPGATDKTSQTSQAFDQLEHDLSLKTQQAVDEGKRDVREAAVIGGSYFGVAIDPVKVCFSPPSLRRSSSRTHEDYFPPSELSPVRHHRFFWNRLGRGKVSLYHVFYLVQYGLQLDSRHNTIVALVSHQHKQNTRVVS